MRLKLGTAVELEVIAGGQYVTGLGELGSAVWFPSATAFAVDAGGALTIGLVEHVRLRVNGLWQRTFVTLNRGDSTDTNATEQYISAGVTVQWAM
jgi:hypothetical protein